MGNEEIGKAMLKKAIGYEVTESTTEFTIDDKGVKKPVKEKYQTKVYPPDPSALKAYLTLTGSSDIGGMTDEELEEEKNRLIAELRA
ncbi:MAG: hypothetical protein FWD49_06655 [Firmicutes bacterium]|nr:hypothetical protein [Bacillota bacterium]